MSVGPKRNVMKDLKDAFKAKDPEFHFGLYYSLFEWYNPLYLNDKKANISAFFEAKLGKRARVLMAEFKLDIPLEVYLLVS